MLVSECQCVCACVECVHGVYVYECMCIRMFSVCAWCVNVCTRVYMYIYVCLVFVHGVCVCTQVCMCVYVCFLFVYVYVCVYIFTCAYIMWSVYTARV